MTVKPWKKLDSKSIVDDRWIRLTADTCELPNGEVIEPFYVLRENDFVHVFALDCEGALIIVRQYRYPGSACVTELPGGIIDDAEDPETAALRELREETGYSTDDLEYVGNCFVNPARQTNRVHIVLARNCRPIANQELDISEVIEHSTIAVNEVPGLIARGEFSQAMHIASYYWCLRHLQDTSAG